MYAGRFLSTRPFLILFAGLDLPHATAILPDGTIEIHNIDSQNLVQVIPPPPNDGPVDRTRLVSSLLGYIVPSDQYLTKMSKVPVKLDRRPASKLES